MGVWGVWALLLLLPLQAAAQAQVCSVNKTVFEVKENTEPSGPLLDIYVPEGQQVILGPSSTPFAFKIQGTQLFLNVTPDYEENTLLQAHLECMRGDVVVTQLRVFVSVLDVNDNPPVFPFEVKVEKVPEDTKVNTTVIPAFLPPGSPQPNPLILRPGPIYAVDGDRAINQRIIYSLVRGNEDGIFVIDADSGNLTMTKSVPSPKTFLLMVKGDQEDHARYSVTQVTVEAHNASESLPRFPASLYRGTVALGSALGTVVQDAAEPSLPLRVWAQDPEFPDLNSAITYRITNNSDFRMSGEAVLTAAPLTRLAVFYAEVEATNTVTSGTATTVVEIHVSEQEPTSTVAGGTTRSLSSTTSEAPRSPGPSRAPSTTSSGGSTGPNPPSGTTLRPPASSTPGAPPSAGTSNTPPSASPSRGSAQTPKPGTSQPVQPDRTPWSSGSTLLVHAS
ncbi:cadherin-related family member 5 [Pteropus vampyrus]|uniref:Cadherin-related family member 5 n=1 Tax=Pteropus vampyrus TaxID=132908 RepID=A0A6P3RSW9_PTEVA|nr:cadherin-related family member 5 [Pteropus vampyrus]